MYSMPENCAAFCLVILLLAGCAGSNPAEPGELAGPPPSSIDENAAQREDGSAKVIATPMTVEEQLEELRRLTDDAPPPLALGKGDILSVSVYDEPDLTIDSVPVRPDGKIALPLVGEMAVEGRSVGEVTNELTENMACLLYTSDAADE